MFDLCDVSSEQSYDVYCQCLTTKEKAMSAITIGAKTTFDGLPVITMPDGCEYYIKDNKPYKLDPEREARREEQAKKKAAIEAVKESFLGNLSNITITWDDDKGKRVQTETKSKTCLISNDRALGVFEYVKGPIKHGETQEVHRAIHTFYISETGWRRNTKVAGVSNLDASDIDALIRLQMEIGWV